LEHNMASRRTQPHISIQDRLEHGNLNIDEVCALKQRCKTGFYADVKAGLVAIEKVGRRSIVRGPVAKQYIAGEPSEAM